MTKTASKHRWAARQKGAEKRRRGNTVPVKDRAAPTEASPTIPAGSGNGAKPSKSLFSKMFSRRPKSMGVGKGSKGRMGGGGGESGEGSRRASSMKKLKELKLLVDAGVIKNDVYEAMVRAGGGTPTVAGKTGKTEPKGTDRSSSGSSSSSGGGGGGGGGGAKLSNTIARQVARRCSVRQVSGGSASLGSGGGASLPSPSYGYSSPFDESFRKAKPASTNGQANGGQRSNSNSSNSNSKSTSKRPPSLSEISEAGKELLFLAASPKIAAKLAALPNTGGFGAGEGSGAAPPVLPMLPVVASGDMGVGAGAGAVPPPPLLSPSSRSRGASAGERGVAGVYPSFVPPPRPTSIHGMSPTAAAAAAAATRQASERSGSGGGGGGGDAPVYGGVRDCINDLESRATPPLPLSVSLPLVPPPNTPNAPNTEAGARTETARPTSSVNGILAAAKGSSRRTKRHAERAVRFAGAKIHCHARLLNGSGCVPSSGPPLGISWRCYETREARIDVLEVERVARDVANNGVDEEDEEDFSDSDSDWEYETYKYHQEGQLGTIQRNNMYMDLGVDKASLEEAASEFKVRS